MQTNLKTSSLPGVPCELEKDVVVQTRPRARRSFVRSLTSGPRSLAEDEDVPHAFPVASSPSTDVSTSVFYRPIGTHPRRHPYRKARKLGRAKHVIGEVAKTTQHRARRMEDLAHMRRASRPYSGIAKG